MSKIFKILFSLLSTSLLFLSGCSSLSTAKPFQAASISRELVTEKQYQTSPESDSGLLISANQTQINFLPDTTTYTWLVNLSPGEPQTFVLQLHSGDDLFIHRNGNMTIQLYDATNLSVAGPNGQSAPWEIVVPKDGAYELVVSGSGPGVISTYVPVPVNAWTPILTTAPLPDHPQRVSFNDSATTTASTNLPQGRFDGMNFHAQSGQRLQVAARGDGTITLLEQGYQTVAPATASYDHWEFDLPSTGDYLIVIQGEGVIQLTLTLSK